jgi:hypothetical protein
MATVTFQAIKNNKKSRERRLIDGWAKIPTGVLFLGCSGNF